MDNYELGRIFRDTLLGHVRYARHKHTNEVVVVKEYFKHLIRNQRNAAGVPIAEDAEEELRIHQLLSFNNNNNNNSTNSTNSNNNNSSSSSSKQQHDHVGANHVIQLYSVVEDDEKVSAVMELASEGDLFSFVQSQQQFNEPTARHYFTQLLRGVLYLHEQCRVAHRDLSLENVLIGNELCLKICDFGVAMEFNGVDQYGPSEPELVIVRDKSRPPGKLKYMAPEIFAMVPYDPCKADMWSCGIILFVMLSGTFAYELPSPTDERFRYVIRGRAGDLIKHWGRHDLSAEVSHLLQKLLCPQEMRYSAREALQHPWITGQQQQQQSLNR